MAGGKLPWNLSCFENHHQIGGIQIARIAPHFGGDVDAGCRVALVNTGALRFTVALDRGGDIIDAFYNEHSLAFLTPVGLTPPNHAYHGGMDWLRNWPGGLVTTCGPHSIGGPRSFDGEQYGLHGHHSNCPARLDMCLNPDLHAGKREMLLSMTIRSGRMFGPVFEVKRQIQCTLGEPRITLYDQVTNRGDQPVSHHWLYHVNFGYPLLDEDSRFIYKGRADYWNQPKAADRPLTNAELNKLKRATGPLKEHAGIGERGLIVEAEADAEGKCHVGIINDALGLGCELSYDAAALPRVANWQHFGPAGSYVAGVEPFNGSLMGVEKDNHPRSRPTLAPGETMRYQMTIQVHSGKAAIAGFAKHDGKVRGE